MIMLRGLVQGMQQLGDLRVADSMPLNRIEYLAVA